MIRHLLALITLSAACAAAEPKPILVILEQNPWLHVIGSDSPTFALYDDGTVAYLRDKPTPEEPFHSRRVADAQKAAKELFPFDLAKAKNRYTLSSGTDAVTSVVWTPSKTIRIYGEWRKPLKMNGDPNLKALVEHERKMWESLPGEIRQALFRIDKQRKLKGTAWLPATVEVMFWPYENAGDESILWPEDWPGLLAPNTKKRREDFYSVYVPSEKLPELRRFLESRKQRGAVLISGKKMSAIYRFPFPGELEWMRSR